MDQTNATKLCMNCHTKHARSMSAFCTQDCFDDWYTRHELPSLVVDLAIQAMEKNRNANTRNS